MWGVLFSFLGGIFHYSLESFWPTYVSGVAKLNSGYLKPLLERPQSSSTAPLSVEATNVRADVLIICGWALLIGLLTPLWNLVLWLIDWACIRLISKGDAAKSLLRYFNRLAITDEIEQLLTDAAIKSLAVQVTLSNGKMYVGKVIKSRDPANRLESFRLQPMMSGYRDKDDGTVEYNTFHYKVLKELEMDPDGTRASTFQIAVPLDQVVVISGFDMKAYKTFVDQKPLPTPSEITQTLISGNLTVELARTKPRPSAD